MEKRYQIEQTVGEGIFGWPCHCNIVESAQILRFCKGGGSQVLGDGPHYTIKHQGGVFPEEQLTKYVKFKPVGVGGWVNLLHV